MMATGYVHPVADGRITDLRDFAMRCARGFGALITMRDAPFDAPIPERLEPNFSFYDEALAEARAELMRLTGLTPAGAIEAAAAYYAEEKAQRDRYAEESATEHARVRAMRDQVAAWVPDPEVADLKRFMLEQLDRSLGGGPYEPLVPKEREPHEWHREAIEKAAESVGRYEGEIAKEIARTAARNSWLQALRASLPADGALGAKTGNSGMNTK